MDTPDTIYVLENRLDTVVFHWFMYMISGLLDIHDKPKPIKIHVPSTLEYQKTTIELLNPDFEFIENISGKDITYIHGAVCVPEAPRDLLEKKYYQFVRNQLMKNWNIPFTEPFRKFYIRRNRAHVYSHHQGLKRRHVWEEDKLCEELQKLGYESIYMEDYPLREKIQLMREASVVIAPNSGGLTFCLFAHPNTKVIEIHDIHTTDENQYYNICKGVDLDIRRYTDVNTVSPSGSYVQPGLLVEYMLQLRDIHNFIEFVKQTEPQPKE